MTAASATDHAVAWTARIPGVPVAKGRPRVTRHGRPFTPAKTRRWERDAARILGRQWGDRPALEVPVEVEVVAIFPRPQRLTWKTRPMPRELHAIRPDADNVAKAAVDALQLAGVVREDSSAWRVEARKYVAAGDEEPAVEITVRWTPEVP